MIARLTPVQRRVLALILLLAVIVVVARVLIVPMWNIYSDNRDAIVQMEDSIARYARISAQVGSLRQAVEDLAEADELTRYVLAQESESIAAAALQERVKSIVTTSGGALTSTQVLPAVAEKGFKRVIVNVRMAVSIDALQRVLYELENGLPYLLASDMIILSRNVRKRGRTGQSVDLLDVRFNLSGYMRDAGEVPA